MKLPLNVSLNGKVTVVTGARGCYVAYLRARGERGEDSVA